MPKKYLNRHVLDGLHQTLETNPCRINEIYQWHRIIDLRPYQECNPRQELEELFRRKQIDGTFNYLDGIAREALGEYLLLKDNRLSHQCSINYWDLEAQKKFAGLFERTFDTTFKVILPQQIKKATHQILAARTWY
jgi:hypothetical protein